MTECTLAEALAAMRDYGSAVHCEMAENDERFYDELVEEDRQRFYQENGCIVAPNDYEYNGRMWLWRQIHQVSPEADLPAMIEKYRAGISWYSPSGRRSPKRRNPAPAGTISSAWGKSASPMDVCGS